MQGPLEFVQSRWVSVFGVSAAMQAAFAKRPGDQRHLIFNSGVIVRAGLSGGSNFIRYDPAQNSLIYANNQELNGRKYRPQLEAQAAKAFDELLEAIRPKPPAEAASIKPTVATGAAVLHPKIES